MRHTRLVALLVAFPLGLGGCNLFGGGGEDVAIENPTPVAVPTGEVVQSPAAANGTAQAPANAPAAPAGTLPPELISSTNPAQRVQAVQRNRPDPFALIPTTPTVEISPTATAQRVPQLPSLPNRSIPANGGNNVNGGNRGSVPVVRRPTAAPQVTARPSVAQPGSLAPIPNLVPNNPIAAAPLPPQPTLAQAVKVTGVVQIGNTLHAIVSAPNEPSSRYVRAGQRLSNGQVLVKRIEINRGSEPIVVLEENGVEVQTAVGSGGSEPTAAAGGVPPA